MADDDSGDARAAPKVVSGVEYRISSALVRGGRPWPKPVGLVALALTVVGLSPVLVPWYLFMRFGPERMRNKLVARALEMIMGSMDKAMRGIKLHLFRSVIPKARVLDVGAGTGQYLKYFSAASHVTELEPNPEAKPLIEAAAKRVSGPTVEVFVGTLDQLPLEPKYDVAVLGNVCCELPLPLEAILRDVDARLKDGGHVVFLEHVRMEGAMGLLQDVVNPVWSVISGGCNCNRDTLKAMRAVPGWRVTSWDVPIAGPTYMTKGVCGIIEKVAPAAAAAEAEAKAKAGDGGAVSRM